MPTRCAVPSPDRGVHRQTSASPRAGTRVATPEPSASSRNPATSINRAPAREPVALQAKPAMLRRMTHALRQILGASLALLLALGPSGLPLRAYAFDAPEGASGFAHKALVKAKKQMVVAAQPLAAEAGLAILRKGGSAA